MRELLRESGLYTMRLWRTTWDGLVSGGSGLGVITMHNRIEFVGRNLEVRPSLERGTTAWRSALVGSSGRGTRSFEAVA